MFSRLLKFADLSPMQGKIKRKSGIAHMRPTLGAPVSEQSLPSERFGYFECDFTKIQVLLGDAVDGQVSRISTAC